MAHQAGVRTVSVGGRAQIGPMQAVSGSRGAASYSADQLDNDIKQVNETLSDEGAFAHLPDRSDTGMWINYAGFTVRDQVRDGDDVPLQFKFEAADCRVLYTLRNVYNMTQLWHDVASAIWDDTSLCVEDSTGYPSIRNNASIKSTPTPLDQSQPIVFDNNPDLEQSDNRTFEIHDEFGALDDARDQLSYNECRPSAVEDPYARSLGSDKCLYMDINCTPNLVTTRLVAIPVMRRVCETDCPGLSQCRTVAPVPDKKSNVNANVVQGGAGGGFTAPATFGYCMLETWQPLEAFQLRKTAWCKSGPSSGTPYNGRYRPKVSGACQAPPYVTYRVTRAECAGERRVFGQTTAVWTPTLKDGARILGVCRVYTCSWAAFDAVPNVRGKPKSETFFWV